MNMQFAMPSITSAMAMPTRSSRLRALIATMQASVGAELGARRAIRHLRRFDDHMLEDIGLQRERIVTAVRRDGRSFAEW
jgi:uncharacterized protein YjiS (DUF1127 family)